MTSQTTTETTRAQSEITIRVQYHPDCRGGGLHVWERFPRGVRGLGLAIDAYRAVAREAVAALGNIGCRGVWIYIDDEPLDLEPSCYDEYRTDTWTAERREEQAEQRRCYGVGYVRESRTEALRTLLTVHAPVRPTVDDADEGASRA